MSSSNHGDSRPFRGWLAIARIAGIFSLSCGAVVDMAIGRYAGKGQGESTLIRTLWDVLQPSDLVLTKALPRMWPEVLLLKQGKIDFVGQLDITHIADVRRGKRLGNKEYFVCWAKTFVRWMD